MKSVEIGLSEAITSLKESLSYTACPWICLRVVVFMSLFFPFGTRTISLVLKMYFKEAHNLN